MNEDLKNIEILIIKHNANLQIVNELEKIKIKWNKEETYINNDIEWDDIAEAEDNFNILRNEDKKYIKELILTLLKESETETKIETEIEKESEKESEIEIERESEDNIKIYRPKKIYGDIPGIKKRGYIKTSKEIEGTKSVKEENANYIYYNLYEVIDDTIKIMRDIHQNPDYIKWIQINYNTNTNINKTINNLPKLMQTYSFSISNKKRIESINNYRIIINSKLYNNNEIKLNFKSKNNFKINLIEELYINIIYILHNNLHNYDVDKFFALLNSLLKENTKKIYDYFVTKTLDNDNYCICI